MLLVKLGGSVITRKSKLRTARPSIIRRLAEEVADATDKVVLVHGAGSFGHILANKYHLHEGYSNDSQLRGVSEVQRDMRRLNLMVIDALVSTTAKPISIPSGLVAEYKGGKMSFFDHRPFHEYIRHDSMPVTFGDVVRDTEWRFAICSGDDLMLELSKSFRPKMSLYVTDVDGIFTDDPKRRGKKRLLNEISRSDFGKVNFSLRRGTDITGGIERKLERIRETAGHARESWILNGLVPGRLRKAVQGKPFIGTKVVK